MKSPRVSVFELTSLLFLTVSCGPQVNFPELARVNRCNFSLLPTSSLSHDFIRATADQLHQKHCYQEAIWLYETTQQDSEKVNQTKQELATLLTTGPFKYVDQVVGGTTFKHVLEFENGVRALFKSDELDESKERWKISHQAEIAAYQVSELLNLSIVPMTVGREIKGKSGSLQYFMLNLKATINNPATPKYEVMRVFDFIIQNVDRPEENFLYWPSGNQVIAIDHGAAFKGGNVGEIVNIQQILFREQKLHARIHILTDKEIQEFLKDYLTEGQISSVAERLNQIRSQ